MQPPRYALVAYVRKPVGEFDSQDRASGFVAEIRHAEDPAAAAVNLILGSKTCRQSGSRSMREISAAGGKAEAIACDVTDEAAVNATVARFLAACGPPRILVNGAACRP